jgi:hypothetical protein
VAPSCHTSLTLITSRRPQDLRQYVDYTSSFSPSVIQKLITAGIDVVPKLHNRVFLISRSRKQLTDLLSNDTERLFLDSDFSDDGDSDEDDSTSSACSSSASAGGLAAAPGYEGVQVIIRLRRSRN